MITTFESSGYIPTKKPLISYETDQTAFEAPIRQIIRASGIFEITGDIHTPVH
jgi:hypothetical protein